MSTFGPDQSQPPAISNKQLALIVYILYFVAYFTGITALIGVIIAHVQVASVLGPPGRVFRDGGGQLPLAEHAGIAEHLERLRAGRRRDSAQHNRQPECPHGPLPCPGQCVFRNARASATAVRALSASPAIDTIFSEYSRALALSPDFLAALAAPT